MSNNFADDIHTNSREKIQQLLEDQATREEKLLKMIEDLKDKIDLIQNSLPLSEEERAKNRMIRLYNKNGIVAPFFHSHSTSIVKPKDV